MHGMDRAISLIELLLFTLAGLVLQVIGFIDALFSTALSALGVPLHAQGPLLLIGAIILAIAALRLLGRFIGAMLLVLFLLLLLHPHMPRGWVLPHGAQVPSLTLPGPHKSL
ncbi:hypothetical protein [Acidocella sp.]|nr:hypothetical protein [Acidocella sp.]